MNSCFDDRKEWLEQRKAGIGGTDISAVLNLNPWKTALDVYLGKTGRAEMREPSEAMYWGNKLEPLILEKYAIDTGLKVAPSLYVNDLYPSRSVVLGAQTLIEHADMPYCLGTPDGIAFEIGRGIEVKTAGFKSTDWGKAGTDEVPHHYRLQVSWYMAITGLEVWDIAALFSGNNLEIFTVARDRDLEDTLLNAGADFWNNNVLKECAPPIDGSEAWKKHLSRVYAVGNQTMLAASPEIDVAAEALRFAQEQKQNAVTDEGLAKNHLAQLLGENKGAKLSAGGTAQWVRSKPGKETDWEALAKALNPAPELIAEYTKDTQRAAYVRLYEGRKK